MKTTILILALCLFSFSLESSTTSEDITFEQDKVTIHHSLGNGQFIELEVDTHAVQTHLSHGDHFGGCIPPAC